MKRHERISDRLYTDLFNGILIGDFPPQSTLPTEMVLAQDYGISRSTVRIALDQLKSEGLIVSHQGAGTVVADFTSNKTRPIVSRENLADLEKCFECRIVLEPEIAAIASQRRTQKDITYLLGHLDSFEILAEKGGLHTSEDTNFHLFLAGISGNKFFESIMLSLRPHILFGLNLIKTIPEQAREDHAGRSLKEHEKIVAALVAGDPQAARSSMCNHLENSRHRIFHNNHSLNGSQNNRVADNQVRA